MSNQYQFTKTDSYKDEGILDTTVLVEDGEVWDQEEVQVSLNYSPGDALTEHNEDTYLTAHEVSNDTHYFSVLETTTESTFNDLHKTTTLEEDTLEESNDSPTINNICSIGGEPDLYRIEGCDDLYAFEVACDEDGNLQRFRYRLRLNEDNQYETVPDSVELLPLEDEPSNESPNILEPQFQHIEQDIQDDEASPQGREVVVKQELLQERQEISSPNVLSEVSNTPVESNCYELYINNEMIESYHHEEQPEQEIESKSGILEKSLLSIGKTEITEETHAAFDETLLETENLNSGPSEPSHDFQHDGQDENSSLHDGLSPTNYEETCNLHSENGNTCETPENSEFITEPPSYQQILLVENHDKQAQDDDASKKDNFLEKGFIHELNDDTQDDAESNNSDLQYLEQFNENDSDTDDYHIVEGVHVTADTEDHDECVQIAENIIQKESCLQNQILKLQQKQVPILQSATSDDKLKEMVNNNFNKLTKSYTYYVVKHPEKENVAAIAHHPTTNKVIKTNPRSLLKSSYVYYEQKKEVEKKSSKKQDALQAKVYHNYLAKTTIVQAPIRQQRLPRKQTIKPVERADEEIIVQEVVVCSNGFVETSEDGVIKSKVPLKPTEIVQLSDSDDDYDPKKEYKRKKKQKKRRVPEIVISDSEEESTNQNIIRIDLSADSNDEEEGSKNTEELNENSSVKQRRKSKSIEQESCLNSTQSTESDSNQKKKRGRPPKRPSSSNMDSTDGSLSSKKQCKYIQNSRQANENKSEAKTSAVESEFHNIKTKWKCSKCPKTFPSQGSLKSHMQYHKFHEPNARQNVSTKEENFKKPEAVSKDIPKSRYNCSRCDESFKNNVLLSRHMKAHENAPKSLECGVCHKIFADRSQLLGHKRIHAKQQMANTTILPKDSPKSTKHFMANIKLPKPFTCSTCTSTFASKFALDDHIRRNCVKQSRSPYRRLSLTTRRSLLVHPQRVSQRLHKGADKNNISLKCALTTSDSENAGVSSKVLKCDSCAVTFKTHTALFTHKVIKHGFNTPDKTIKASEKRRTLHKQRGMHGSVPANTRLGKAYVNMKAGLDK